MCGISCHYNYVFCGHCVKSVIYRHRLILCYVKYITSSRQIVLDEPNLMKKIQTQVSLNVKIRALKIHENCIIH